MLAKVTYCGETMVAVFQYICNEPQHIVAFSSKSRPLRQIEEQGGALLGNVGKQCLKKMIREDGIKVAC